MTDFIPGLPIPAENIVKMDAAWKCQRYLAAVNDGLVERARELASGLGNGTVFRDRITSMVIVSDESYLTVEVHGSYVLSTVGQFCVPGDWVERINELYPGAVARMQVA